MSAFHEVTTRLSIKDEATAVLRRYIATLREVQAQVDASLVGLKELRDVLTPNAAALAAQREALSLAAREADLRAAIGAETVKQSESILASRRASLALAREELGVQRDLLAASAGGRGGSWRGAANRLGNDFLWTGGGILGAAAYATQRAISFNQTALETDVALGGYNRSPGQRAIDIRALQRAAMAGSEATGFFSAQQILEGLKVAASSGARPLVERMGMNVFTQIAPALSRYMDVVGRLKGESADSAAMEGIRQAHMFGAYTPDAISRTLNAQAALALLMPDKMSTATTTAAYAVPSGVNLAGIPQEAILALIATADQSGLGRGRAGARLKDYIEAIAVRQSKTREAAKAQLGLAGALDAHGNLDLMKSFEILQADARRMGPQAYRNEVRTAFGGPGSVVAAMFADPSKQAMFEANRGVISQAVQHGDLTTIQDILKGGVGGKEALMLARLNNDIIQFGQYGLPIAVRFFDTINPKLKEFGDWLDKHPKEASKLFDDLVHTGEGLLMFGGALKGLAIVATIAKSLRTLYGAFEEVTPVLATFASKVSWLANLLDGALVGNIIGQIWGDLHDKHPHPTSPDKVSPRDLMPFGFSPRDITPYGWVFPSSSVHASAASPESSVHVASVVINLPSVTDGPTAAREIAAQLRSLGSQQQRSTARSNPSSTTPREPYALQSLDLLPPHTV